VLVNNAALSIAPAGAEESSLEQARFGPHDREACCRADRAGACRGRARADNRADGRCTWIITGGSAQREGRRYEDQDTTRHRNTDVDMHGLTGRAGKSALMKQRSK
jgi:hypothetical protein